MIEPDPVNGARSPVERCLSSLHPIKSTPSHID
jgi:hypothetical protein